MKTRKIGGSGRRRKRIWIIASCGGRADAGWGGSSSINGMIYIRGHARDYDQWRQTGLTGWGFSDVLPYFRKVRRL